MGITVIICIRYVVKSLLNIFHNSKTEMTLHEQIQYFPYEVGRLKAFPYNVSPSFKSTNHEGEVNELRIVSLCASIGLFYQTIVEDYLRMFKNNPPVSIMLGSYPTSKKMGDKIWFEKKKGFDPLLKVVLNEEKFKLLEKDIRQGALLEVSITWRVSKYFAKTHNPNFPNNPKYKGMKLDCLPNFCNIVLGQDRLPIYGEKPMKGVKLSYWL